MAYFISSPHVTSHVTSRVQSARILRTHVASKHVSGVLHRKPTKVVSKLGLNQGGGKLNKTHISKLPVHNNLTNNKLNISALSKGRLAVPLKLKPKFTLTKLPNPQFQKKMGPFVQKLWKKPGQKRQVLNSKKQQAKHNFPLDFYIKKLSSSQNRARFFIRKALIRKALTRILPYAIIYHYTI